MKESNVAEIDFRLCCIRGCNYPAVWTLRVGAKLFPFCPKHKGAKYCPINKERVIRYPEEEFN